MVELGEIDQMYPWYTILCAETYHIVVEKSSAIQAAYHPPCRRFQTNDSHYHLADVSVSSPCFRKLSSSSTLFCLQSQCETHMPKI